MLPRSKSCCLPLQVLCIVRVIAECKETHYEIQADHAMFVTDSTNNIDSALASPYLRE